MGIIGYLWSSWGRDNAGLRNSEVDFYNVNIPLVAGLLDDSGLKVCWTRMWHSSYGRLFKPIPSPVSVTQIQRHISTTSSDSLGADLTNIEGPGARDSQEIKLVFEFAPDITGLINPELSSLPVGTDGWANAKGWASVTPLRAVFAEPSYGETLDFIGDAEDGVWKIKL
jgi:hypothetical protein